MAVFVITASQRQKPLFGESRTSRAVSSRLPDQVTAAHPLHDQRCVLLGRFLPTRNVRCRGRRVCYWAVGRGGTQHFPPERAGPAFRWTAQASCRVGSLTTTVPANLSQSSWLSRSQTSQKYTMPNVMEPSSATIGFASASRVNVRPHPDAVPELNVTYRIPSSCLAGVWPRPY